MSANEDKPSCPAKGPQLQSTKRRPETDLNHDNWDEEEEPEEQGEFKKANEEQLKDRKILTAKRKQKPLAQPSMNPFGSVNLASSFSTKNNGSPANPVSMFNFASLEASAQAPKFDFSCITSTTSSTGENRQEQKRKLESQSNIKASAQAQAPPEAKLAKFEFSSITSTTSDSEDKRQERNKLPGIKQPDVGGSDRGESNTNTFEVEKEPEEKESEPEVSNSSASGLVSDKDNSEETGDDNSAANV